MKTIRYAVIGWGFMGRTHAQAARGVPLYYKDLDFRPELSAVCSRSQSSVDDALSAFDFKKSTLDWHDIVNDPEIDAVSVCTPNAMHEEIAIAALEAGKHVYIDKPLADNYARKATIYRYHSVVVLNGDAVVGIGANGDIADICRKVIDGERIGCYPAKDKMPLNGERVLTTPEYYAYLKIADGCNNCCTYCAIP